jgi:uncharacterized Zn finger protein
MINARGIPTCICPECSSDLFKVVVKFDPSDYEIGIYLLDGECAKCGTLVTIPTPMDHPNNIRRDK